MNPLIWYFSVMRCNWFVTKWDESLAGLLGGFRPENDICESLLHVASVCIDPSSHTKVCYLSNFDTFRGKRFLTETNHLVGRCFGWSWTELFVLGYRQERKARSLRILWRLFSRRYWLYFPPTECAMNDVLKKEPLLSALLIDYFPSDSYM